MATKSPSLNSLMNYRFVKKQVPKLTSGSESLFSSDTNGIDSPQGVKEMNKQTDSQTSSCSSATILYSDQEGGSQNSETTIPYNPSQNLGSQDPFLQNTDEELTCSPESPIFRGKVKGSNRNCIKDEDTEPGSSPWLSKEQGIVNGAASTSKQRRKSKQEVRQGFGDDLTPDQTEAVNHLKAMFPDRSMDILQQALEAQSWNVENAVDQMIDSSKALKKKGAKKRIIRVDSSDSDGEGGSPIHHPSKRARPLDSIDLDQTQISEEEKNKRIVFLQEAFPGKKRRDLQRALENNNWQTDDALLELSNFMDNGKERQAALEDEEEDFKSEDEEVDSDDSIEMDTETARTEREKILAFFDEATIEELSATPGCSKKRAEVIISLRPFKNWNKLTTEFYNNKALSYDIISGCKDILRVRQVIVKLMQKCEGISKKMETVVSCLTKKTEFDESSDDDSIQITKQPQNLSPGCQLKPFQMVGLNWLRIMHSQHLNGILADEMGLGKTIQTIAFIAHLLEEGETGPHVVIVPSSTIENWMREFETWCPEVNLLVYYGSVEDRRQSRMSLLYDSSSRYNVVLTTYNMATGSVEDRALFKKVNFHYAIFDEGHMLKNMSSLRYQNLMKIAAERRLLLTGTPLQNNLLELMSLLCFVMPEIFSGKTDQLKQMFSMINRGVDDKAKSKYERERIQHAKRIMRPFVLRRLKSEVQRQLPQKKDRVLYCELIPQQRALYQQLITKFKQVIKDDQVKESRDGASMLMQLRKASNHPLLLRNHYTEDKLMKMAKQLTKEPSHRERGALAELIHEDMMVLNDYDIMKLCDQYKKYIGSYKLDSQVIMESGKFRELEKLLETYESQGDRVLLFSQFTMMMDIMEDFLKTKNYSYLRLDGSTPVPERQELIDKFTKDESIFIFMLSTRAGGLGINLTAANVVIIHDIDFNPYNDKQAEDRCHRVGQTREVSIIRLISKDTVEEGMLRCARDKLKLEKDITTDESTDKENPSDVASLLKGALADSS
ncbi:SWI/SNF-related matrix-associated actin-dependent regulator of chromatin subfamily A containing DEAD/H box 1B-like [Saccostrea echinata]|uniref:SWI/SNF-related matrix-associated actin-dependent regulator of chromatin subfamily A containing DEAD/H box 1B-like n=1 Tax=Saccostrea echinata TaxID=191078 RepID=UPI002A7F3D07|nr:SWI/SNF-related matrix-associated actin-dependent regulator of chromatin subfamily A containing DEAD/H box 1B-like [Saccostrea echinata]